MIIVNEVLGNKMILAYVLSGRGEFLMKTSTHLSDKK